MQARGSGKFSKSCDSDYCSDDDDDGGGDSDHDSPFLHINLKTGKKTSTSTYSSCDAAAAASTTVSKNQIGMKKKYYRSEFSKGRDREEKKKGKSLYGVMVPHDQLDVNFETRKREIVLKIMSQKVPRYLAEKHAIRKLLVEPISMGSPMIRCKLLREKRSYRTYFYRVYFEKGNKFLMAAKVLINIYIYIYSYFIIIIIIYIFF